MPRRESGKSSENGMIIQLEIIFQSKRPVRPEWSRVATVRVRTWQAIISSPNLFLPRMDTSRRTSPIAIASFLRIQSRLFWYFLFRPHIELLQTYVSGFLFAHNLRRLPPFIHMSSFAIMQIGLGLFPVVLYSKWMWKNMIEWLTFRVLPMEEWKFGVVPF